jgi:hypothetical protein
MFLEIITYFLILMIVGMLIFKIGYSLYNSIRPQKSSGEVNHSLKLEKIIGGLNCPRDFSFYKSGLHSLTKKEQAGTESIFVCLEENPQACTFSHFLNNCFYCKCPLRSYIANTLSN